MRMFFNNFNQSFFAKIPILASNVDRNKEIVGKECIFELNNEREFLEKIKNLKIPQEKEEFTMKKMAENYLKLYSQA